MMVADGTKKGPMQLFLISHKFITQGGWGEIPRLLALPDGGGESSEVI